MIHDDVLEDAEHITNGNIAHRMYSANLGNKVSVLAGDFLLARCSVELARPLNANGRAPALTPEGWSER